MSHDDGTHRVNSDWLSNSLFHLPFQFLSFFFLISFHEHPFILSGIRDFCDCVQSDLIGFLYCTNFAKYVDTAVFHLEDWNNFQKIAQRRGGCGNSSAPFQILQLFRNQCCPQISFFFDFVFDFIAAAAGFNLFQRPLTKPGERITGKTGVNDGYPSIKSGRSG